MSLVSRLGFFDEFKQRRFEFEFKKVRNVSFWRNLNKVNFQKAIENILCN